MVDGTKRANSGLPDGPGRNIRTPALTALAVVVFAEALLLAVLTGLLVVELFTERPQSYASALAILVLTGLAASWLVILGVSVLHRRPWTRGAVLVWQVLQIGVGVGSLQGMLAREDIAWVLIVPAVLALVLLFSKPVRAATTRPDSHPAD